MSPTDGRLRPWRGCTQCYPIAVRMVGSVEVENKVGTRIGLGESPAGPELLAASVLEEALPESHLSRIWVGTPASHPAIAQLVATGELSLPDTDRDAYVIVPASSNHPCVLAARSTHCLPYAAYDYLERIGARGYFCDGYRAAAGDPVEDAPLAVATSSAFGLRVYLQPCAGAYSGGFWDLSEWARELDWAVKARFNAIHLPLGSPYVQHRAMLRLGVSTELGARQRVYGELAPQIVALAKSRGLKVVAPSVLAGSVCPEFKARYPEARTFEMRWYDYPSTVHLHPDDPMFETVLDAWLRVCIEDLGVDPLFSVDCYAEQEPPGTEEQRLGFKRTFARKVAETVRRQGPDARWIMSGWSFVERKWWPLAHIEGMLAAVPGDAPLVVDYTSNYTTSDGITKIHEETDGFYGKPWGWSVFHSFGGNTQLHGDVHALLKNASELRVPDSFHMVMEIVRHNAFYFDLAARLGWDPTSVASIREHIPDFVRRRYGHRSPAMEACWTELAGSVYSWYDMNDTHGPAYQFSPSSVRRPAQTRRIEMIPALRRAFECALGEADRLGGEPCFRRDLVDIAKELHGNLATAAERRLWDAFDSADLPVFDEAATEMLRQIVEVARWAECLPEYHIAEEVERAVAPPYCEDRTSVTRELRTRYTILVDFEHYDTLLDYARRDMCELIWGYYAPRRIVLAQYLRDCLQTGRHADDRELHDLCIPVARAFIDGAISPPFQPPARDLFDAMVASAK